MIRGSNDQFDTVPHHRGSAGASHDEKFLRPLVQTGFFYSREGIRLLFYLFLFGKRLFRRMGLFLMYDVRGFITMVHILHMKNILMSFILFSEQGLPEMVSV